MGTGRTEIDAYNGYLKHLARGETKIISSSRGVADKLAEASNFFLSRIRDRLSPRRTERGNRDVPGRFLSIPVSPSRDRGTNSVWLITNHNIWTKTDQQDPVQAAKEHVKAAADNLHSATKAKAEQFQNVVEDAWSDAQSRAQTWQTEIGTYVQQNPAKAVFMALGIGFVFESQVVKIVRHRDFTAGLPQSDVF